MPVAPITLGEFERLRPPQDEDGFWFRHYAVAWYATADRGVLAVIYKTLSVAMSYVAFGRSADGSYQCTSTASGMPSVADAVKDIDEELQRDTKRRSFS